MKTPFLVLMFETSTTAWSVFLTELMDSRSNSFIIILVGPITSVTRT